jgi:hypothetical protein
MSVGACSIARHRGPYPPPSARASIHSGRPLNGPANFPLSEVPLGQAPGIGDPEALGAVGQRRKRSLVLKVGIALV